MKETEGRLWGVVEAAAALLNHDKAAAIREKLDICIEAQELDDALNSLVLTEEDVKALIRQMLRRRGLPEDIEALRRRVS